MYTNSPSNNILDLIINHNQKTIILLQQISLLLFILRNILVNDLNLSSLFFNFTFTLLKYLRKKEMCNLLNIEP